MGPQKFYGVPAIRNMALFAYIFNIRKCRLNETKLTKYLGPQVILGLLYMPEFLSYVEKLNISCENNHFLIGRSAATGHPCFEILLHIYFLCTNETLKKHS